MQISNDKVVLFHYTLTNQSGDVLDSSEGSAPLSYIHGSGHIIPGLESALAGKSTGDKFNVTIAPEEAYGIRDESLVQGVPEAAFQGVDDIQPGMQFQAESPSGRQLVTVVRVENGEVTVDGNHPLAGETLTFDVEIAEVREASEEELSHGHVHGPDGHHD